MPDVVFLGERAATKSGISTTRLQIPIEHEWLRSNRSRQRHSVQESCELSAGNQMSATKTIGRGWTPTSIIRIRYIMEYFISTIRSDI